MTCITCSMLCTFPFLQHFSVDGDLAASLQSSLKMCLGPLDNKMTAFLEFLRTYGPQKSRPLLHKNLLFWYEVERYKIMFMSDPDNVRNTSIHIIANKF